MPYQDLSANGKLACLEQSIKQIYTPGGCGCISDMPGDNYTCTAHQFLWEVAKLKGAFDVR